MEGTEEAPALSIGGADASRFEVGTIKLTGTLVLGADRQAGEAALDLTSAVVVLSGGDDGLLTALLPAGGLTVPFDLGVVLSSDRGCSTA